MDFPEFTKCFSSQKIHFPKEITPEMREHLEKAFPEGHEHDFSDNERTWGHLLDKLKDVFKKRKTDDHQNDQEEKEQEN